MNIKIDYLTVIIISLIFSLLVQSKFYGFGNDYYAVYFKQNLYDYGAWYDRLGWIISTFSIYNVHLGILVVSFILSFSYGILLKEIFKYKNLNSAFFFLLIYILGIHTWPIIMSTSNAMRQGIVMSLVFISFSYLLKAKFEKSFFFILISIFAHKSGILFLFAYVNVFIFKFISNFIKVNKHNSILFFIFSTFISIFTFYLFLLNPIFEIKESKIIEGDFRYPFLVIGFIFVLIFTIKFKSYENNYMILCLYVFIFISFSILLLGLNWEYERLMMMITLPLILVISLLFNKTSSYFYLILTISFLLILTFLTGMYHSLK